MGRAPEEDPPLMEGWLAKRGPTLDYKWVRRWCVLKSSRFDYFEDETRRVQKGTVQLRSGTRAYSFQLPNASCNPQAPGEAVKHCREKPHGFVIDVDPAAGKSRRLFYFDAESRVTLSSWLACLEKSALANSRRSSRDNILTAWDSALDAKLTKFSAEDGLPSLQALTALTEEAKCQVAAQMIVRETIRRFFEGSRNARGGARSPEKRFGVDKLSDGDTSDADEDDDAPQMSLFLSANSESKRCSQLYKGQQAAELLEQVQVHSSPERFSLAGSAGRPGFIPAGRLSFMMQPEAFASDGGPVASGAAKDPSAPTADVTRRRASLEAVKLDPSLLAGAPSALLKDRDFVLQAVKQNPEALAHVSDEYRQDREVVMAAVARDGEALRHANEELRGDREVVTTAVVQNGRSLRHSLKGLQGDREVVLKAVMNEGSAIQYASMELQKDGSVDVF